MEGQKGYSLDEICQTQLVKRLLCQARNLVIVMGELGVPLLPRAG